MANYQSKREVDYMAAAYEAAGIPVDSPNVIYRGNGYTIVQMSDGKFYFEDTTDSYELIHEIKNPAYIKWDESRGWVYKNGRDLPWA